MSEKCWRTLALCSFGTDSLSQRIAQRRGGGRPGAVTGGELADLQENALPKEETHCHLSWVSCIAQSQGFWM